MNQDTIKEKLQLIHASPVDYTVVFSGKKSRKANGLYKPETREIIIHNRNFVGEDGVTNEDLLMHTAVHEMAHHVMMSEKDVTGSRPHTNEFWMTFYDLLDKAEAKGVYRPEIDEGTQKLIAEARDISIRIANLQRELGRVLLKIRESCEKNGLRYESAVERGAQIGKATAKTAVSAYHLGDCGVGIDIQTEAARHRDSEKREAVIEAGREGKSVVQAKFIEKPVDIEDKTRKLELEKKRVELSIGSLTRRLEEISRELAVRSGAKPENPCRACPMGCDCFTEHTDVRHQCSVFQDYLNKGGEA